MTAYPPIPPAAPPAVNYRTLPLTENGEPLLSLTGLSPRVEVHPFYREMGIPGALPDCWLREGAAARLLAAAAALPAGFRFVVLDGFRPYEVQLELYRRFREEIAASNRFATEEEVEKETARFVAYPTPDVETPPPHMTGGAVDLTVADEAGWLDMGTPFDDLTDRAASDSFELLPQPTMQEQRIRHNRRMLYHAMTSAGFAPYGNEWWHFDYGNQRWAMMTGGNAFYKGKRAFP
ncbi:M15 family metallopeptidase [Paenibacillus aurantius]|uniref:D-alanyl-D-alanine dipeptidase n=1 Tax=Paenibacillus aurantius TaxID=2918900 RepID=A0AA96LBI8_9BACL|nr:M15 family metallopeptidase [Paenibacillus aurantius]WNQ10099.1 M15 family metallopeptidase [Paenibacillus aurantius]